MENKSSLNISKVVSDRGVKKLDLQSIKSLRHDSITNIKENTPVLLTSNHKSPEDKEVSYH
jgi:hypothetical protein